MNLFLTSSLQSVTSDLASHLDKSIRKFLFITTASEVEEGDKEWLRLDRSSMTDLGYRLEDYTFTGKLKAEIKEMLQHVDGIIMAGGNTFYLLKQIQLSECADVIIDFVKNGGAYIGSSAGSMVAGPNIHVTRENKELEKVGELESYEALGLTDLLIQPHWGSESFKDSYLQEIMRHSYVEGYKQVLLCDSQYIVDSGKNIRFIYVKKD